MENESTGSCIYSIESSNIIALGFSSMIFWALIPSFIPFAHPGREEQSRSFSQPQEHSVRHGHPEEKGCSLTSQWDSLLIPKAPIDFCEGLECCLINIKE